MNFSEGRAEREHMRAEVLARFLTDREAWISHELEVLRQAFPGNESLIEKEFRRIDDDGLTAHLSSPDARHADADAEQSFGHYRIEKELGRGGQGVVYLAEDTRLHRRVALKVLTVQGIGSKEPMTRFRREAEVAAKLNHPCLCTVYEAGLERQVPFIAMEVVDGPSLKDVITTAREKATARDPESTCVVLPLTEGVPTPDPSIPATGETEVPGPPPRAPLGWAQIAAILTFFEEVARALHVMHEAHVLHRDIKPGNIMLREDGRPVVMDFGLARDEDSDLPSLTRSGDFFGTPEYMSPEQLTRQTIKLDRRTDVWSLGVTLYESLTLQRPFIGPTRQALFKAIMGKDPPDARRLNPDIPKDLKVVLETALEKSLFRRYQSALDFAEELRRVREHEPIVARPVGPWGRLVRWAQRNKALAAALAACVVILVAGAGVSTGFAIRAERNLSDWERLVYKQRLEDLIGEADALWPACPEKIPAMKRWIERADTLASRYESHRMAMLSLQARAKDWSDEERRQDQETRINEQRRMRRETFERMSQGWSPWELPPITGDRLLEQVETQILLMREEWSDEEIRERFAVAEMPEMPDGTPVLWIDEEEAIEHLDQKIAERLTFRFADPRDQIRHDGLRALVVGLDQLISVSIPSMKARVALARNIAKQSVDESADEWHSAIRRIAGNPKYRNLKLAPQMGLVPIGPDPESGLEEFAYIQTGNVPERNAKNSRIVLTDETSLVFVLIPGGRFMMGAQGDKRGAPNFDSHAVPDEGPPHAVALKPWLLSKYEMTQGQWLRTCGVNPSNLHPGTRKVTLRNPVEQVSWEDCEKTLHRLGLCLPTEAQWEFACRAGTISAWWSGDRKEDVADAANLSVRATVAGDLSRRESQTRPVDVYAEHAPVGRFPANGFGLHDMHGNVWEWCRDAPVPYHQPPLLGDGLRSRLGPERILRGASYLDRPRDARSANRSSNASEFRSSSVGVRPARRITVGRG